MPPIFCEIAWQMNFNAGLSPADAAPACGQISHAFCAFDDLTF